ncbi:MAG: universal stress protein [Gammaproteobacteria bacterium]|nr:universal stress protein [Gammaproteobacteria bacterium]
MAIKDILVHVDDTPACARRMEIAVRLAQRHEAHLTALFARAFGNLPNISSGHQREIDKQRESSQKRFEEAISAAGLSGEFRSADCRSSTDLVTDHLMIHARHVDLVVVGQHDAAKDDGSVPDDLAESVVLGSGRPVLVIPYAGEFRKLGDRVLVAWNGSRESVRAVNDAIPLLGDASRVSVLALNPGEGKRIHGELPSADICLHLSRHGIRAEAQTLSARDIEIGDMFLSVVADDGADLLVMGAYGQPRLRELVLGGATRHILKQMTVPVLMSH